MVEQPQAGQSDQSSRRSARRPIYKSLFFQVFVAVVAGITVGHFWPGLGADLKPLGDAFIKLIKMVIAPLIFCVVVTGIAKVGDVKAVGRIGFKAILYFEVVTTFALVFGLVVANVFTPGAGFNVDPSARSPRTNCSRCSSSPACSASRSRSSARSDRRSCSSSSMS